MKEISKRNLDKVVLVGKGPNIHYLFNIIGYNLINCGVYGLNWSCLKIYDRSYNESFSVLMYNRNIPARSIEIDEILNYEYRNEIDKIKKMNNYTEAMEHAIFILKSCFYLVKVGALK